MIYHYRVSAVKEVGLNIDSTSVTASYRALTPIRPDGQMVVKVGLLFHGHVRQRPSFSRIREADVRSKQSHDWPEPSAEADSPHGITRNEGISHLFCRSWFKEGKPSGGHVWILSLFSCWYQSHWGPKRTVSGQNHAVVVRKPWAATAARGRCFTTDDLPLQGPWSLTRRREPLWSATDVIGSYVANNWWKRESSGFKWTEQMWSSQIRV